MPMPWRAIAAAMGSERPRRRVAVSALLVLLPFAAALPNPLRAAEPRAGQTIFQCDVNGKRVTSDRLIAECVHKEQRELNVDGSLKRIVAPTLTPSGQQALVVMEKTPREMKQTVLETVHFVPLKSGIA